jgi:hypothetical protein
VTGFMVGSILRGHHTFQPLTDARLSALASSETKTNDGGGNNARSLSGARYLNPTIPNAIRPSLKKERGAEQKEETGQRDTHGESATRRPKAIIPSSPSCLAG